MGNDLGLFSGSKFVVTPVKELYVTSSWSRLNASKSEVLHIDVEADFQHMGGTNLFPRKVCPIRKHLSPIFCMATALFRVTIIGRIHRSPPADRGVIIIPYLKGQFQVESQSKRSHFKPSILHFLPSIQMCSSPRLVVTLLSSPRTGSISL